MQKKYIEKLLEHQLFIKSSLSVVGYSWKNPKKSPINSKSMRIPISDVQFVHCI